MSSMWSGALSGLWSVDGNWDMPPATGNDLVFPAVATSLTSTNDQATPNSFGSLTIAGSGYTIDGNAIALAGGVDASQASMSDTVSLPISLTATPTVTVDQVGASLVLGGVISGSGGLTKAGGGLLDLTVANDYTGTTSVDDGVLYVDGAQGGSPVNISGTGTLGGSGTVGTITASSGTVSPGDATPAILTDSGDLDLQAGAIFSDNLGGPTAGAGYSQLAVSGMVNLNGATLDATASFTPTLGDEFTIIANNGGSPVTGTFAGQPEGSTVVISGAPYRISYVGGASHGDVTLTAVAGSTTTVSSSSNSVTYGQTVTLTATVAPTDMSNTATPTGTVDFLDGTTSLGTATLSNGVAMLPNVVIPAGNASITAQYSGDTTFGASTSTPTSVAVAQSSTTTTVSASPSTLVSGQLVVLSATVAPVSPGAGTPTGTVQFMTGTTPLGAPATLTNGVATLNTSDLTTADTGISAHYVGDSNFTASDAPVSPVTVDQASTTTTVGISPNPSGFAQPVLLSAIVAAVTPGSGTPTGTVEFFNGTTSLGPGTLSNGVATFSTSTLPMGPNSITAQYMGDGNFVGSTSPAMTATVNQASTTTVNTSSTSITFGQTVTLSANVAAAVSGSANSPTGSVQFFYNSSNSLGTAPISNGVATLLNVTLPAGSDAVTAQYQGDSNFAGSTAPAVTVAVAQSGTTTTVNVTPNPSGLGQQVTIAATVAPVSPGAGTPTGTVQFFNGSTSLGPVTLNNGVATLTTSSLPLGANTITASYPGDSNYTSSTSPAVTATVSQASTTTLTSSATSIVAGQTVNLMAAVTATNPDSTTSPTGTVEFLNGSALLGSSTISGGVATLLNVTLPAGADMITAQYTGDTNFAPSTSAPVTVAVTQANTTTTITTTPNPSASGASVTITATVAPVSPGAGTPTGSVQFFNGSTPLGTATLVGGSATISTTAITVPGANSITAQYSGDANYIASTAPAVTQTVSPGSVSATTTVTVTPNPSVTGQSVTLTASVTSGTSGVGTPTGTVQFFNGTTSLGTATLSNGSATITTTALPTGSDSITAQYSGDTTFGASTSAATPATVNQASTTTTVTASPNPSSLGQTVSLSATVAPVSPGGGTPTGTVQFFNGTTSLGTATLSNGVGTITTTALPTGSNSITAQYQASTGYLASTSAAVTQTVGTASPTITLNVSKPNPVSFEPVRFTAVVASSGSTTPTGTVNFFANGTMIGTATLSGGQASIVSALNLGSETITAVYVGDTNFSAGTSNALSLVVGDNNELFLNQVYLDLFQGPIDEPGLVQWRTLLMNGYSRKDVVTYILNTPGVLTRTDTLQERILGTQVPQVKGNSTVLVNDLYQALLGRKPSSKELRNGIKVVRHVGGVKKLVTSLFASLEFYTNSVPRP